MVTPPFPGKLLTLALLLVLALLSVQNLHADAPTPHPTPRPTRLPTPLPGGGMLPDWMTPPAPGPTQSDAGAILYYNRCMACHGDQGQGLTTEWRAQWDVEHQNCAKSTCHGPRHPPEGFTFPKNFAPAIVGANTLIKYQNADELYKFVSTRMPYQSPGALKPDEYWQLVAFLLRQRGVTVEHVDETNSPTVSLIPSKPTPTPYLEWIVLALLGVLVLLGSVAAMLYRREHQS